ncbi:MAG TPA: Dabb family protein [Burkholderiaceae bacterium]
MIRHVVLWELHEPLDAPRFAQRLRGCAGIVPGMLGFEVAVRDAALRGASADVCLIATFADASALHAYEGHALHREVSAALAPLRRSRHVADFVVEEP